MRRISAPRLCVKSMLWLIVAASYYSPSGNVLGDPPSSPGEMLEIAELNDICFVDPDRGWAVGDRGVIWQTSDGGRNWQLVDAPATCRLESVFFVDDTHGWIVGGWVHPITHKSSAVVLRTDNGGRKWTRIETPSLPALKWVGFNDPRRGWAVGNSSGMYPAGVFHCTDGGYAWQSFPGTERLHFTTAAMNRGQRLIAVDRDSFPWLLAGAHGEPALKPDIGRRRIHAVAMEGAQGWLVGDGGLVLATRDGGHEWQSPRGNLPPGTADEFDWNSVAVRGPRCWIAGSPGSAVLQSDDGGTTWRLAPTGHRLPLRRVWFLDQLRGWAVGAFGCILSTDDGGRSWRVQREGARRAALAVMVASPRDVPWELLASAAADDGYCTVAQLITRPRENEVRESAIEDRFREATTFVGATSCLAGWPFPTAVADPTAPLEVAAANWDRGRLRSVVERLEETVVRQIRTWRPDVIVADAISPDGSQPLAHLASQVVLQASRRAGDAQAFPEHLVVAGLEPWTVKKVFTLLPPGQRGTSSIDTQRLAIHLGCSLAHYATVSRALLSSSWSPPPVSVEMRLVSHSGAIDSTGRDMFSGIMPGAVGESRRAKIRYGGVNMDSLSRMLQKQRALQELVTRGTQQDVAPSNVLAELDQVTLGLSPYYAGVMLNELGQRLARRGEYPAAANVLHELVDRYPDHLYTQSALLWLLHYYSSAEWQHAFPAEDQISAASTHKTPSQSVWAEGDFGPRSKTRGVRPAAAGLRDAAGLLDAAGLRDAPASPARRHGGLQRSVELGEQIRRLDVPLYQESYIQFPLASVQRRLGNASDSERAVSALANAHLPSAWHACARGEQWLAGETGRSPRPILDCRPVSVKPYLDGILDDEAWREASVAELKSVDASATMASATMASATMASATMAAAAMLAYDDEYLYIAIQCRKTSTVEYAASSVPRARDGDLSRRDRVDLLLDVDRDYVTYYRLSVDHRGWTNDTCCGELAWNPNWHVAVVEDEQQWTIEAAVPIGELVSDPGAVGSAWGLGIQRTAPGAAIQTWPLSASPRIQPEGSGFLLFR